MSESVEVTFPGGQKLRVLAHRAKAHDFATWEASYIERLVAELRPGMVVYDIGAEEGEFSALAAKIVGGGKVHLFEPVPEIWPNIRTVFGENDIGPGGCFVGFVGARSAGVRGLVLNSWPNAAEGPIRKHSGFAVIHERPDLPTITVDDYATASGTEPDVLMIDVEGAEVRTLLGARETLARARPLVFVSIHPPGFLCQYGETRAEGAPRDEQEHVFRLMSETGYVGEFLGHDHESHWLFTPREG